MVGIIFNFNMFDDPYNQTKVNQGFKKLEKIVNEHNLQLFLSVGNTRSTLFDVSKDDYVIVQHTKSFDENVKKEIAEIIKEILTIKKSNCKTCEAPKVLVVFEHVDASNYFVL